jgi:hypothetical protein
VTVPIKEDTDMSRSKTEVVSFKADEALLEAMRGVTNRSEFIRSAILAALDSTCPLCGGAGTLTPNQMRHWNDMSSDHSLEECEDCREVRLVCSNRRRK